jgi:hypothetical protein
MLPMAVGRPVVRLPAARTSRATAATRASWAIGIATELAIGRKAGAVVPVPRELGQGLDQSAIRAVAMPVGDLSDGPHIAVVVFSDSPGIACFRPRVEAVLAVAAAPGEKLAARAELLHRLPLAAVATSSFTVTVVQPPWHVRFAP